ncbi:ImmA/IrrE family metallo-endopeptidase [Curtobacterium sp. Curtsp57]|uniref:ImmA/IrrE family metallo-endopeptidase n=1 Tax=Curtobacterium sp. Curtsp57 TaxID=3243047 RepID=UPI0039B416F7
MTDLYDPRSHAAELGVPIVEYPLRADLGRYIPALRTILIRPRMRAALERSVLAHEIVHAERNECQTGVPLLDLRMERNADTTASLRLIEEDRLVDLMRWTPDPGRWAIELGVTADLLEARITHLRNHRLREAG